MINHIMEKFELKEMKCGWYIGDFLPSAYKTNQFEVCFTKHKKDEFWDTHFHKVATEITLILKGKMEINDNIYLAGDIIVIHPNEVASPVFLEDTELVIVKTPSDVKDKFIVSHEAKISTKT